RYSTTENEAISGETYFSILDVGTTQLTLEDITFEPFSHEESENKYYDSFTTAVNKLNEHNYSYSITCVDEDNRPVQKSKSCITSDGWSGMDEAITYTTDASFSENIYFGTHKNEDQTIDYYYGQAPDELSNVSHIRDIYYSITNFSFSPEIWDFNLSESTEEEYHFTLSDEIVNIYKTRVITSLMTNDVFSQQALDISRPHLVINSDGTIKWFDFVYENYDETFTLTQNFYDYGTTEIPPSIADFTNHVPYPRT
ncbi:MAG: hypothetical protein WCR67_06680, partial [Bacilli bacterium]